MPGRPGICEIDCAPSSAPVLNHDAGFRRALDIVFRLIDHAADRLQGGEVGGHTSAGAVEHKSDAHCTLTPRTAMPAEIAAHRS